MAIQTLSKFVSTPLITLLLYGKTGTGKTTLGAKAAQFDEFAPLEIIDFDLRLDGLVESLPPTLLERIRFQSYRDATTPGESFDRAFARLRELEDLAGKPDAPRTIFLDSLTFFDKASLDMVVYLDAQKGHKEGSNKERYGPLIAAQDDYGPTMQHIERFVQRLTGLKQKGYNIFVSAHEKDKADPITGRMGISADVTGKKLPNRLPGYFNEYWHTELQMVTNGSTSYLVRTKGVEGVDSRTTFSSIINPVESQDQIWNKIITHLRKKKQ